jgi:hypothetical protein
MSDSLNAVDSGKDALSVELARVQIDVLRWLDLTRELVARMRELAAKNPPADLSRLDAPLMNVDLVEPL